MPETVFRDGSSVRLNKACMSQVILIFSLQAVYYSVTMKSF